MHLSTRELTMTDNHQDKRYEYSFCSECGREWQNIDFWCALHQFSCTAIDAAKPISLTETKTKGA
jgi:hypothetical protein